MVHTQAFDILPFLFRRCCKKAFHDINLSNGENIPGARGICSKLLTVLLCLLRRGSFSALPLYFNKVLFYILCFNGYDGS